MAVMKDKAIEEAVVAPAVAPVVAPEITPEPVVKIVTAPVVESVEIAAEPKIDAKEVAVQAKKEETVAVGGQADERVVVGGPLRGTNFASDGTAYLFTTNGVCAIFKKHLLEFQARGCSQL